MARSAKTRRIKDKLRYLNKKKNENIVQVHKQKENKIWEERKRKTSTVHKPKFIKKINKNTLAVKSKMKKN